MDWIVPMPEKIKAWTFLLLPLALPPPSYPLVAVAVGVATVAVVIAVSAAAVDAADVVGLAGLVATL